MVSGKGKPAHKLKHEDVVLIPPNVNHWHDASRIVNLPILPI